MRSLILRNIVQHFVLFNIVSLGFKMFHCLALLIGYIVKIKGNGESRKILENQILNLQCKI